MTQPPPTTVEVKLSSDSSNQMGRFEVSQVHNTLQLEQEQHQKLSPRTRRASTYVMKSESGREIEVTHVQYVYL
jgi:hypothetical protein